MSSRDSQAKEIFLDACDREPSEREELIESACAGDRELERRVRELLEAHRRAALLLDRPPAWPDLSKAEADAPDGLAPGARIEGYRLIEEIGEGGFGTVWRAEQESPVRREVALKVLKAGLDTRDVVRRFEAERQALALMDHPCIARVLDGGATPRGLPYFAMELVQGRAITDYCESRRLSTDDRLRLFLDVCRAVQHAHQKGVIHRDIKPSNVLVTEVDGRPVPKVIDFGIAKAVERKLTDSTLFTRDGVFVGTPAYMSPEQVDEKADVDTRSDVYALGVLLYELLSDTTPFDEETVKGAGFLELQRLILEVDPPRPSMRLSGIATTASGPERHRARARSKEIRGDLDWIVMRCLEKARDRRYDSADVLANEIERYLRGEPVLAGPPLFSYRLAKMARRHRAALTFGVTVALLLVGGIVVSTSQAVRARRAERVASEEKENALAELAKFEAIALFLQDTLLSVNPEVAQGRDRELLMLVLRRAAARVEQESKGVPEVEGTLRMLIGQAWFSMAYFDEARPHLARSVELFEASLGPDALETLDAMNALGALLLRQDRYDEAEPYLIAAVTGRWNLLGDGDERTLVSLSNLANLYGAQQRYGLAEDVQRRLLAARTRMLGERAEDTVTSMNNLAMTLSRLGRTEETIELLERALEIQVEERGPRDPRMLSAMNNLAREYVRIGRFDEARGLLEGAVEAKREVYRPGHPSLITSLVNLAQVDVREDRLDEAAARYADILATCLDSLGPRDLSTATVQLNLGSVLRKLGRFEEAEELLVPAVETFQGMVGDSDQRTLAARDALAVCMLESGRPAAAELVARDVAGIAWEHLPEARDDPIAYRVTYGRCLLALHRPGEAIAELEPAYERAVANGHPDFAAKAAERLEEACAALGREEEAGRWRGRAKAGREE